MSDAGPSPSQGTSDHPSRTSSLSQRLLLLTVAFVMFAEILIYLPSVARFRVSYLEARVELANLAALALVAAPDAMVSAELEDELLSGVGARQVAMHLTDSRALILSDRRELPMTMGLVDLGNLHWWDAIADALQTIAGAVPTHIRVLGPSPRNPETRIEVVLPTEPLVEEARDFSFRIFWLSLAISAFTASLVYLSLRWLLVKPMQKLIDSIVGFRAAPENARHFVQPSGRSDELGLAERELLMMQTELRQALTQRVHLAQLGVAVSKISHDLRNMLASAQLVSDRLALSEDPTVRQVAPRLVDSVNRAIALCATTLKYGKAEEQPPRPEKVMLHDFAEEVCIALGLVEQADIHWQNRIPTDLAIAADPEQLHRVLMNLLRNAMQAMPKGGILQADAVRQDQRVLIEIADSGTGLSAAAQAHLFEPFRGGARQGGTGLGLAIARELMRGMGGDVELAKTSPLGTTFRILAVPFGKN